METEAWWPPFRFAVACDGRCPRQQPHLWRADILDIYLDIILDLGVHMTDSAQKKALRNYRTRLAKRGIARFEVLGLDADRDLIRSLAKRLAEDDAEAARIRAAVRQTMGGEPPSKGGILAALRRSPLVGADLTLARSHEAGRKVDL
jgi:hypothetical protein